MNVGRKFENFKAFISMLHFHISFGGREYLFLFVENRKLISLLAGFSLRWTPFVSSISKIISFVALYYLWMK